MPRLAWYSLLLAVLAVHTLGCGGGGEVGSSSGPGEPQRDGQGTRPQIATFTASPAVIAAGGSSTLAWTVTGATSVSIDGGIGAVTGTSLTVRPAATTTYTLSASNATGVSTATATVTVATGGVYALPADRATSWNLAGMLSKGGIPSASWPACNATPLAPRGGGQDDAAGIQALVDGCAPGTVARLAAGTFTIGEGKFILLSKGIVLRGAGAGATILDNPRNRFPSGSVRSRTVQQNTADSTPIVIVGPQRWAGPDGDARCNGLTAYDARSMQRLAGDAQKGSRSVTVESGAIFRAGQIVLLDETSGSGWQPDRVGIAATVWASPDYAVEWNLHPGEVRSLTPAAANNWAGWGNGSDDACWFSRQDRPQAELKEVERVDATPSPSPRRSTRTTGARSTPSW